MIAKIKAFFKGKEKYNPDLFNIHHPDFVDAVEPAFKVETFSITDSSQK